MGRGEPFGSPKIGRVIRFTSLIAVLAIQHRFKGFLTQMVEPDRIGDRLKVKQVKPVWFLKQWS